MYIVFGYYLIMYIVPLEKCLFLPFYLFCLLFCVLSPAMSQECVQNGGTIKHFGIVSSTLLWELLFMSLPKRHTQWSETKTWAANFC